MFLAILSHEIGHVAAAADKKALPDMSSEDAYIKSLCRSEAYAVLMTFKTFSEVDRLDELPKVYPKWKELSSASAVYEKYQDGAISEEKFIATIATMMEKAPTLSKEGDRVVTYEERYARQYKELLSKKRKQPSWWPFS